MNARDAPDDLPALTGLRAVAALWVVAFHATAFLDAMPPVVDRGYLGVDLFFVLSGFTLTHVYAARFARDGLAAWPSFVWRRVARLWPAWLFVLALFALKPVVSTALGWRAPGSAPVFDPAVWATYAALMQSWGWTPAEAINPPGWSLSYEWAAYLLFPLVLALVGWTRGAVVAFALAAAALLAHAAYTHVAGLTTLHTGAAHGAARIAAEFTAGAALCRAWTLAPVSTTPARPPAPGGVSSAGRAWVAAAAIGLIVAGLPRQIWADHLLVAGAGALVVAAARGGGAIPGALSAAPMVALGRASYALYVVHWLVFEALWSFWHRSGAAAAGELGWPFFAAMVALSILAASALHAVVEAPARRWLRARWPERGAAR